MAARSCSLYTSGNTTVVGAARARPSVGSTGGGAGFFRSPSCLKILIALQVGDLPLFFFHWSHIDICSERRGRFVYHRQSFAPGLLTPSWAHSKDPQAWNQSTPLHCIWRGFRGWGGCGLRFVLDQKLLSCGAIRLQPSPFPLDNWKTELHHNHSLDICIQYGKKRGNMCHSKKSGMSIQRLNDDICHFFRRFAIHAFDVDVMCI